MPSDRPQVSYRVDPTVKRRFEAYVDARDETGQGRYGRHLETAMLQYLEEDRLVAIESAVEDIAHTVGAREKKGKGTPVADGMYDTPKGKNPGDVGKRQQAVINYLLDAADDGKLPDDDHGHFVTQKILKGKIEEIADVHSTKTVKKYLRDITKTPNFRRHPERPGAWVVRT